MKNNYLRNVLLASLILITHLGFAQMDSQLEWSKLYGGSDWHDRLYSSKPTLDGGIITIGRAASSNGFVHGWRGQDDVFVLLLDAQGDTVWTKTYGGAYRDYGRDIVQTTDSNFVFAAYTNSDDANSQVDTVYGGYDDYWVVKIDKDDGSIIWQKSLGGTGFDRCYSLVTFGDGSIIVGGESDSDDEFVSANYGSTDIWLVKLDASGNMIWEKNYGGDGTEYFQWMTAQDSIVYFVGSTWSDDTLDVSQPIIGYYDFWVVKIDTSGNKIWDKRFGSTGRDDAWGCDYTYDHGVVVAGYAEYANNDVDTSYGDYDYWVIKLDASGNLQWKESYGGMYNDRAYDIIQTSDSGYFVSGFSWSPDGLRQDTIGMVDAWVLKLDKNGQIQYSNSLGGVDEDWIYQSHGFQDANDAYVITGYTESSNSFDIPANPGGYEIGWVAKLKCNPGYQADICMVLNDSVTGKNKIVWEDAAYPAHISHTNIYRETGITGVYQLIGSVLKDSLSEYIDTSSSIYPLNQAHNYRISAVDTCGNESDTSNVHKTVHLVVSTSGSNDLSLQWNDYSGFTPSSYKIYRYTNSSPTPVYTASVSYGGGSGRSWTDFSAPQNDTAHYFIIVVPPYSCTSSKNYNEGRSNTAANTIQSLGIDENKVLANVIVSPNPANNLVDIAVSSAQPSDIIRYSVNDITGSRILGGVMQGSASKQLNIQELSRGVYFIRLETDKDQTVRKLVIQ